MKPVKTTPDLLVIEDHPWALAGMVWLMSAAPLYAVATGQTDGMANTLIAAVLGLGAAGIAWWFFPFQTVVFDRSSGEVTRTIRRIGKSTTETLRLDQIKRAANQGDFSDSGSRMERVALMTNDGPYPLELGFVGTSRAPVITAINDWLGV
ncbi:MAG: hypothetical protein WA822_11940 [Albidovulum sp.]